MTRRAAPIAFALAGLLATVPLAGRPATVDPRVATLVAQSGKALHASAMASVHVVEFEGAVEVVGLSGTGENWSEIGGTRSAQRFSTPPLAGGNGWDGTASWNLDQSGLVWVDGGDAGRAAAIDQAYASNDDLWTPNFGGAAVSWAGTKTEKGRSYDVLTIAPAGSYVPFDLWFDRTTHLPARMVQVTGPLVAITSFADYRPVDGLVMPFTVVTMTNQGNGSTFEAKSVTVNPKDGDSYFAKPMSNVHDFSIAGGKSEASVPIQMSDNHVYVDVVLDGKGPYHFIFDTGGQNIVDPAVAKAIGASGNGTLQTSGVGNATEAASFTTVDTLQIGDATVKHQVFAVLPVRKGFGVAAGLPVDGLIGFEVLSRFVTTFDYANDRVTFHMPGTYAPPQGAGVVPIAQNGQQPQFACSIDAVATTCTVDTGSRDSATLFAPFLKANPQIVPKHLSAAGVNGFGVGGPSLGVLGRIATLSFGPFALHDVVGDYTTQAGGAFAMPFVGANVGGGVWKRFAMTLDYGKLTMALVPNDAYGAPDAWDRSGLFLLDTGTAIAIVDARRGTPAAKAGLVKGDAIVSIDGKPASSLTLKSIREMLSAAPGTTVRLVIKAKDGTTRAVQLTLADYV